MLSRIPKRLGKEPLVDALFEVHFAPSEASLASSVPGFLMFAIPGIDRTVQSLPLGSVPKEFRDSQPGLSFQPLVRLEFGRYFINVGDRSLIVGAKLPYSGWSGFRSAILSALDAVLGSGLVTSVVQCSIRYIDVVEQSIIASDISALDLGMRIAGKEITIERTTITTRLQDGRLVHDVMINNSVDAQVVNRGAVKGIIINTATIDEFEEEPAAKFKERLPQLADEIHASNKKVFFGLLTEDLVAKLDPIYE
ncbi:MULTISPECIES: TIGR04255 family protein [Paraburkholderia]|uniref:TIGR04255 family protein n=1 Tax=Paraburkholderia TaxID=1822464 RepID=UPI0021A76D83|nr:MULTISPECIES: TIGR04255 family protein [Paraburkholderia]